MMQPETLNGRLVCEALLREKAARDPSFRQKLIEAPAEAISSTFGQAVNAEVSFHVIEEGPGEIVLVLPPQPDELSDQQLATASGGYTLNISFEPSDLAAVMPSGNYKITLIKSAAGTGSPVWMSFDPFKANQITWQDGYSIFGAK